MNEQIRDPAVSERYRDLAAETAPEALNEAVLREARQQKNGRYSRNISWLRPMAWAASIGLCLAIVLELNNMPQQEPSMMQLPASSPVAASPSVAETGAAQAESRFRATTDAPSELDKMADLNVPAAIAERTDTIPVQSDDFAAVDAPAMDELETLNRMREGSNISEIPVGSEAADADADSAGMASEAKQAPLRSMAASVAPTAELIAQTACPAADREAPETWLDCIKGLETDGMTELAAREREELRAAFPEFEMP